ncbi:MAG: hypothetical protein WB814_11410, partial [Candidatus Sulfotelmatobacter sp.]
TCSFRVDIFCLAKFCEDCHCGRIVPIQNPVPSAGYVIAGYLIKVHAYFYSAFIYLWGTMLPAAGSSSAH